MAEGKYLYGLGRRKSATARARLYAGKGNITINDKTASEIRNAVLDALYEMDSRAFVWLTPQDCTTAPQTQGVVQNPLPFALAPSLAFGPPNP